jgi:hypothetical protein
MMKTTTKLLIDRFNAAQKDRSSSGAPVLIDEKLDRVSEKWSELVDKIEVESREFNVEQGKVFATCVPSILAFKRNNDGSDDWLSTKAELKVTGDLVLNIVNQFGQTCSLKIDDIDMNTWDEDFPAFFADQLSRRPSVKSFFEHGLVYGDQVMTGSDLQGMPSGDMAYTFDIKNGLGYNSNDVVSKHGAYGVHTELLSMDKTDFSERFVMRVGHFFIPERLEKLFSLSEEESDNQVALFSKKRQSKRAILNQVIGNIQRDHLGDQANEILRGSKSTASMWGDQGLRNFMLGGQSKGANLNRLRFCLDVRNKMVSTLNDVDERFVASEVSKYISDVVKNNTVILDAIDNGRNPKDLIANNLRIAYMSQKEYDRALHMTYLSADIGNSGMLSRRLSLNDTFALAKLPSEWLQLLPNKPSDVRAEGWNMQIAGDFLDKFQTLLPYLSEAGRMMAKAQSSGDKALIKEVNNKHTWLSKSKCLPQAIRNFDEKYKFRAQHRDYTRLLGDFTRAINLAALQTHDWLETDEIVTFDSDDDKVYIDPEILQRSLEEGLVERGDLDYVDVLPYSEIDRYSLAKDVEGLGVYVKDLAIINDKLHKQYGDILKKANRDATFSHAVEWTPLEIENKEGEDLSNVTTFKGFSLHNVNSRQDLLEEGTLMGHCVFSYYGKCLSGESVILSAKDEKTGDRIATVELALSDDEERLEVVQCYGQGNNVTDQVKSVELHVQAWLDSGVALNVDAIVSSSDIKDELCEHVESDPMANGSVFESIPYDCDGVYWSYLAFNQFTPEGMSIESVYNDEGNQNLLYNSEVGRNIGKMNKVADALGVSAAVVLDYKFKNKITSFDDIETQFSNDPTVKQELGDYLAGRKKSVKKSSELVR